MGAQTRVPTSCGWMRDASQRKLSSKGSARSRACGWGSQAAGEECSGGGRAWEVFDGTDGGQGGEQGSLEALNEVQSEGSWARCGSRQSFRSWLMGHLVSTVSCLCI